MISSTEGAVSPNHELAYLSLVSSSEAWEDWQKVNQKEILMPDAVTEEDEVVQGPLALEQTDELNKADIIMTDKENLPLESVVKKNDQKDLENVVDAKVSSPALERRVLAEIPVISNISGSVVEATNDDKSTTEATQNPPPPPVRRTSTTIPPTVPPRNDSSMMFGSQQDVTECIENVLFQIEAALKPQSVDSDGEQIDMVKELFYGKTQQTLEVRGASGSDDAVRTKEERFSHLIVDVAAGPRDIYDALDSYFDVETVDLDGKPARRYVTLLELPPILQIQIQRVQYDRGAGRVFKSNAPIMFDETIYLDRYMNDSEPGSGIDIKRRRGQMWEWKEELSELEKQRADLQSIIDPANDLTGEQTVKAAHGWLKQVQQATIGFTSAVDPERDSPMAEETLLDREEGPDSAADVGSAALLAEVLSDLENEMQQTAEQALKLESQISDLTHKINEQYTDLKQLGYRIHSVFIHRGQATFGHYWIYIHDFEHGVFRKYNDEYVSEVKAEEVMPFAGMQAGSEYDLTAGTPYFLVFVREDMVDELIQAVKREFAKAAVEPAESESGRKNTETTAPRIEVAAAE